MSCSIREAASCQRLEKGDAKKGRRGDGHGECDTSADLKPPWPELLLRASLPFQLTHWELLR